MDPGQLVHRDLKVVLVHQVGQDPVGLMVHKEYQDLQVHQGVLVQRVDLGQMDLQAQWAHLGLFLLRKKCYLLVF